jgi:hypothetical protein
MGQFKHDLGAKVKDKLTPFTGTIVARTEYLTGCSRYSVQSAELKDGKPADWVGFDESQLELVTEEMPTALPGKPGGPAPDPQPR